MTAARPYRIKRGDTWPPLTAQLLDANGVAIDLSTASSVKFVAKRRDGGDSIGGACAVADAGNGRVSYTWQTGDTDTPGSYNGEFEISWSLSTKETVPTDGYFQIFVVADQG